MASPHWRRNLYVCLFGSFTTLVSMTLLLPFLPVYVEQLGVTMTRRQSSSGPASRSAPPSSRRHWCNRSGDGWPTATAANRC